MKLLMVLFAGAAMGLPLPRTTPIEDPFFAFMESLRKIYMNEENAKAVQDLHESPAAMDQILNFLDQRPPEILTPNNLGPERIIELSPNAEIAYGDNAISLDEWKAWYTPVAAYWEKNFNMAIVSPDEWDTVDANGDKLIGGDDIGAALRTKADRGLWKAVMSLILWQTVGNDDAAWEGPQLEAWMASPIGDGLKDLPPISEEKMEKMAEDIMESQGMAAMKEFEMEMGMEDGIANDELEGETPSDMMVTMMRIDMGNPDGPVPTTLPESDPDVEVMPVAVPSEMLFMEGQPISELPELPQPLSELFVDMPGDLPNMPATFVGEMGEDARPVMEMQADGSFEPLALSGDAGSNVSGRRKKIIIVLIDNEGVKQPLLVAKKQVIPTGGILDGLDGDEIDPVDAASPETPVEATVKLNNEGQTVEVQGMVMGEEGQPGVPEPVGEIKSSGEVEPIEKEIMNARLDKATEKMTPVLIAPKDIQRKADGTMFMTVQMPDGSSINFDLIGSTDAQAELVLMEDGRLVANNPN